MRKAAKQITILAACALAYGCTANRGVIAGNGASYRAEFEHLKAAVLAAADPDGEAKALRELGGWFRRRPYGYTISTPSQPEANGVDVVRMQPGELVELRLHAKADYEPRGGSFTFVPKDPTNLLLLASERAPDR